MRPIAVFLTVLSGLCFLPAGFPHSYVLVEKAMSWTDARTHCREKYTDLASVGDEKDLAKLDELTEDQQKLWIGLRADPEAWRWALEDEEYYQEGQVDFRLWADGEPDQANYRMCAVVKKSGKWSAQLCDKPHHFFCYDKGTSGVVQVTERKTWDEARRYCRESHTDLASVRSQVENDLMTTGDTVLWIGLYRNSWKWSDGGALSVTKWADDAPTTSRADTCVSSDSGKWTNAFCGMEQNFVCYGEMRERKVVKVVLETSDLSLNVDALQEDVLRKFDQRVKEVNVGGDLRIQWVKQSDGQIFHTDEKKNEEDGIEEADCIRKQTA